MNYPKLKLISICFLLSTSNFAWAQTNEPAELAEARKLNLEVVKLFGQARYDEALPLATRALELRQKVHGQSHRELIPLHINLAELYSAKKKHGPTREHFERALAIAETSFPENDKRVAELLHKLGLVTFQQGDTKDAERFFARALKINETALGPENIQVATNLFNLAEIYRLRRNYEEAEPLYERLVRIREKAPGKDNADLRSALEGYLLTLLALKKTTEANAAQEKLNKLFESEGILRGGVLNGKALKLVQPEYPMIARSERAAGMVRVQIIIDETGRVISAKAVDSGTVHSALVVAAENAARRSLFTATYLSGKAVKVSGIIIYNFVAR